MPWSSGDSLSPSNLNRKSGVAFNVKEYGAAGDGATNDATALQAAIDAAGVSGGVVFFPAGAYRVNSTLVIDDTAPIILRGIGDESIISYGASTHMLRLKNAAHAVEHLQIRAASTFTDGRGIIIESTATDTAVRYCKFVNTPASAVEVQQGNVGTVIAYNRINAAGYGSGVNAPFTAHIRAADVQDCQVIGNRLSNGTAKGIDFGQATSGNTRIRVEGNNISNFSNIGIGVGGSFGARIANNAIQDCQDNGIDLNALSGISHYGTTCIGNFIDNCKDGIFFGHEAQESTLQGNTLSNCTRGIRVWDGATHVVINGNVINATSSGPGILVHSNSSGRPGYINIVGNLVREAKESGVSMVGCDVVSLVGNVIRRPANHGITGDDADVTCIIGNEIVNIGTAGANTYDAVLLDDVSAGYFVQSNLITGATRYLFNMGNSVNGTLANNVWDTDGSTGNITGINSSELLGNHKRGDRTPAASTTSGTAGESSYDNAYYYVCTSTDSWGRLELAQF